MIPSIIANHQKRTLETQFAKTYRTLSQMVNLAIAEHGGIETWDWKEDVGEADRDSFVEKYFLPYLNVVKFCSALKPQGCFAPEAYKYMNGTNWMTPNTSKFTKVVLADGATLQFYYSNYNLSTSKKLLGIHADVNGKNKPNVLGRDVFVFFFFHELGEFFPSGAKVYNQEDGTYQTGIIEDIDADCLTRGASCAAKIVAEGFKMNY